MSPATKICHMRLKYVDIFAFGLEQIKAYDLVYTALGTILDHRCNWLSHRSKIFQKSWIFSSVGYMTFFKFYFGRRRSGIFAIFGNLTTITNITYTGILTDHIQILSHGVSKASWLTTLI